jgi:hypothetical protein
MAPHSPGAARWAVDRRCDVGGMGRVSQLGRVAALIRLAFGFRELCWRLGDEVDQAAWWAGISDLDAVLESDSLDEWSACVRHIDDESSARGITFRRRTHNLSC